MTSFPSAPGSTPPVDAPATRARGRRAAGPVDAPRPAGSTPPPAPSGRRAARLADAERAARVAAAAPAAPAAPTDPAAVALPVAVGDLPPAAHAVARAVHGAGQGAVHVAQRGSHRADPVPAAPNRAERRRRREPRRRATRVAQGAVAVGLALGVGGFALAPVAADRTATTEQPTTTTDADTAAQGPRLTPQVVEARQAAVVLASSTVQSADTVKADAVASAVPAEAVAALTTAVADLDTLITTTQSTQPALTALLPARLPAPVLAGDRLDAVAAAAASAAEADAAAASGATSTSDQVSPTTDAGAAPTADATTGTGDSSSATADDTAAARLTAASERVATLTAELQVVTVQTQEAAAAAAAAAEEARKEAQRTSLDSYDNGRIPASALADLAFAPGQQLRADAAESLEQLNVAFAAAFGRNLVITDSYRSYSQQVACRQQKGSLCATPGTSNHGNGTAIDLGGDAYRFGSDEHDWMLAHAEEYGWTLPSWARATGSKPEPWHWEFTG
ncbi:D-alanyl-D-alanine carboxypeptidase family protein [Cellulomonas sp. NPDC058312]|uniref:M15 family metallopeptidase n=1 Tax=Cellulomonas sp. NPDC058312 TaxID=3346441 RepID=UPI0036E7F1FD